MSFTKRKVIYILLLLSTFILSSCVSTMKHKYVSTNGFNKEISINPSLTDKAFLDKIQLSLVRQSGFRDAMIKMKSEELKTLILKHNVSYNDISFISCRYCAVTVRTEITRISRDKATITHSEFTPLVNPDTGIRPMVRDGLMETVIENLNKLNNKIESTLSSK